MVAFLGSLSATPANDSNGATWDDGTPMLNNGQALPASIQYPAQKNNQTLLWIGAGAVVVILAIVVAVAGGRK